MRVIYLALKDLAQIMRDKKSLLFLVAMPIVFTLFMGFAYGQGTQSQDPRLTLAVTNQDTGGVVASEFIADLERSTVVRVQLVDAQVSEADLQKQVGQNKYAAALVIPQGFSDSALAGEQPRARLVADQDSADGQNASQAVRAAFIRALSSAEIARLTLDAAQSAGLPDSQFNPASLVSAAEAAWQSPALNVERVTPLAAQESQTNPYTQSSPGMLVQFAVFGLITSANVLVMERQSGALQRLQTTSVSSAAIMAGHMLAMFVVVFLQQTILVLFGQFAFAVNYLSQPAALLLVMVSVALWASALGMFIGVMAHSEDQVILYAMAAMFLLSALGGAWFPLETTGGLFARVGSFLPSAQAMTAFQNLVVRGLGLSSVLMPSAVMLAYACGFFGLAIARVRK
jgi:ABC-2 type transport system permease protein